ncbi:MAG: hypothetical protein U9Q05_06100 [Thermodesulfobacteriota bacterium]|nr:hypothetical protein [Thermodesulfobacteriota bacterium]
MQNVLFVQFFSRSKSSYCDLTNGFSDTYDLCRGKGDFFWVEHEGDSSKWHSEKIYTDRKLPIDKGTVYVSAAYINHFYQAYIWSRHYPEIEFIVGGPVTASRECAPDTWDPLYFQVRDNVRFPGNLKITGQSVEDIFGTANFSGRWQLEVPHAVVDPESPIYLSYTLDNSCYWGKCIYCNIKEAPRDLFRRREIMNCEFAQLPHPGRKIVRLNTGSITPKNIREILPSLPRRTDLEYRTFMRSAKAENQALKNALAKMEGGFPALTLGIGIEFPSDRMLRFMGKGITNADILETLRICGQYKVKVNGNVILGWGNLLEEDVRDLEQFFENMPDQSMTTAQLRWLYAHPHTIIHEQYQGEPTFLGPFYLGFSTEISPEQMTLNQEAVKIIQKYSQKKRFKLEGLGNMKTP